MTKTGHRDHPDPDVIVFHGGCWDGFASAMTAYRATVFGPLGQLPEPALVPAGYGTEPPDVTGKHVMICDFSYPPDVMAAVADEAETLVWLDHHKTAIDRADEWVHGADNLEYVVDSERSAATITYDWFHPDAPGTPWPIRYIEDRDLWTKALPDHEAVVTWIRSHDFTRSDWNAIRSTDLETAVEEGQAMTRIRERLVSNVADQAFWADIDGNRVLLATASYDIGSDVADLLIRRSGHPVAGYVLINAHGEHQYGLRSVAGTDCSPIAVGRGGGGHAQACGFRSGAPAHTHIEPAELWD